MTAGLAVVAAIVVGIVALGLRERRLRARWTARVDELGRMHELAAREALRARSGTVEASPVAAPVGRNGKGIV